MDLTAFAELEREDADDGRRGAPNGTGAAGAGIHEVRTANTIERSAEGDGAYALLASMVERSADPPPDSPQASSPPIGGEAG